MSKIQVRNLCKVFGNERKALELVRGGRSKADVLQETGANVALNDISLDIDEGEIFVVMGLSGSGKSTLVRHFNRLIEPTEGRILIDGEDILGLSKQGLREFRRTRMSMVFQAFGLLPTQTTLENVAYGRMIRGERRSAAFEVARRWVATVGLSGYEQKYPDELSGGMKQRVGLARALAADTDILLMDEAFSALDPLIRTEMQDQLLMLQASLKKTIVFITHDIDEALRIGNRIAILRDGRLEQIGTRDEIVRAPANDYVRRFVEKRPHVVAARKAA